MVRIVRLLVLVAIATPAWGRDLSLVDALSHAQANRDLRTVSRQETATRAQAGVAKSVFDPTLVASTQVSGTDSAGFVAGFPMESRATNTSSTVGIQGTTATGTGWEIGTDLGRESATTLSSLSGVETEQVQTNWKGLVDLTVSQDVLAPFRQSASAIAAREAGERVDTAMLATAEAEQDAVLAIADAWWNWSSAHRLADSADRAVEEATALESMTQARFDEQQLARLELSRARSARLDAERDVLTSQADVRATADRLLLTMGEAPGQAIEPGGDGAIAG